MCYNVTRKFEVSDMDFYMILQKIIDEKSLSIPDVARATDLSDSTVRSILTRKQKTVALPVAMKISKGLNIPLEILNGETLGDNSGDSMNTDIYKDFGKRLSVLRNEKQLSQQEVSKYLGIAQTTYSGYENGVRKIPLEIIDSLADFFKVSPTYLVTGKPFFEKDSNRKMLMKFDRLNESGKIKAEAYIEGLLENPEFVKEDA